MSLAVAVSTTAMADDQASSGASGGYHLVWQDTFDNGVLDETNNWNIEVNGNGGGNNELQYYRRENISVGTEPESGAKCLVITAKKESYQGKSFTSGRLTTQNKMFFTHGKIEARIKLPSTANGLWPAFWMLGQNYSSVGWPRCGEIDILEMGNATGINNGWQSTYFNGACHWGYYINGAYPNYAKSTNNSYSLQDGFHLYSLIWDGNAVKMYLDLDQYPNEDPYYAMDIINTDGEWATGKYFHDNFFVLFNMAIGGYYTGILNASGITALNNGNASMYIDYVKVYQKGTADESFFGTDTPVKNLESTQPSTTYSIYNINGVKVSSLNSEVSSAIKELPSGVYIMHSDANNVRSTRKIYIK